jgi:hypothetical protein
MTAGLALVWRYKTTPGPTPREAPAVWPSDIPLARVPGRTTVVMLAHPQCPCTRASVNELAVLFTRIGDQAIGYVLFMAPSGAPEGWEQSDTWDRAAEIRGVTVLWDKNGEIAHRLGATVSGHTVVYDATGHLVFAGGITAARGHEGDNAGRRAIEALVAHRGGQARAPTFGCELDDPPSALGAR